MIIKTIKSKPIPTPPPTVQFIMNVEEATFIRDVLGKFSNKGLKAHFASGWPSIATTDRYLALADDIYNTIYKALDKN